jgi:glucosamine 6-phosphate synthetase-like amidotransferase/phosphosugar isomerase protein
MYESDKPVEREVRETALSGAMIGKGNHRHFVQKEIFEQPAVIGDTLHALFNPTRSVHLGDLALELRDITRITIIACGTSFHSDPFVAPILYSIPIQLLAYHIAVLTGTDVDQPRNLTKSVTVE